MNNVEFACRDTAQKASPARTSGPCVVAEERGYIFSVFDASNAPPLAEIEAVSRGSWNADYKDKAYFKYDAEYLRWLMPADGMVIGLWATTSQGTPVGCVMAVARELYGYGRRYHAYYGTMLSVVGGHRGTGLGISLMQKSFDEMMARGADLYIGTFDGGQAGRPAISKAAKRYPGYQICESQPMAFWACMTDLAEIDRYEPFKGIERAALLPGMRSLIRYHSRVRDLRAPARRASLAEVYTKPREDLSWAIGPGLSVNLMYTNENPLEAGTIVFDFSANKRCFITYHCTTMTRVGMPDRRVGNIQLVSQGTASTLELVRALRYVNTYLLDSGCLMTAYLDGGLVPKAALALAGFAPIPRTVCYCAMGPQAQVAAFQRMPRPYFSDIF